MIGTIVSWLTSAANRPEILQRLGEHVQYSLIALILAALIGIPLGLYVGHTGRGRVAVVNLVNGVRSIPTLGLLFAIMLIVGPRLRGDAAVLIPSLIVLVVLAVPPILAGTYAGIDEVDPAARDAAKGMGMRPLEVLRQVEIPIAWPLIMSGVRAASLQLVATATIAATVGLGGLGRFVIDGIQLSDYPRMAGGAILVALLALAIDGVFAVVQRFTVSRGLTKRYSTARRDDLEEDGDTPPTDPTHRTSGLDPTADLPH